jgi:hypothetical protein
MTGFASGFAGTCFLLSGAVRSYVDVILIMKAKVPAKQIERSEMDGHQVIFDTGVKLDDTPPGVN